MNWKHIWRTALMLLLVLATYWVGANFRVRSPLEDREPRAGDPAAGAGRQPLLLAHVADPRIGAPPGGDGRSNTRVLADAIGGLRAGPGVPAPSVLVITGEVLTPAALPPAETTPPGRETGTDSASRGQGGQSTPPQQQTRQQAPTQGQPPPATRTATTDTTAADSLGTLLAASPVADIYLVPTAPIPARLMERVRTRALEAGVRVHDLTSCYTQPAAETETCRGEVRGTAYRVIGLPSVAGLSPDSALAAMARLAAMEADGREDGRLLVLAAPLAPADSAGRLWEMVTSRPYAVAALTGTRGGARSAGAYHVRTPSLGNPPSGPAAAAPWVSLVTLSGQRVGHEALAPPFRRAAAAPVAPARRGWLGRLLGLGDRLGEPARTAVFWIGLLAAFLTVAALWKVPELVRDPPRPAGGAQPNASVGAGAQGAAGAAQPASDSVFTTNLGRTVLSGLTGVALVALLKEIWGISGAAGQAFFVVVFIVSFFAFLLFSALSRGWIDASTSLSTRYQAPDLSGVSSPRWRHVRAWWKARRSARLVFSDSFVNVLFGQGRTRAAIWEDRFQESQRRALGAVRAIREEISAEVRNALQRSGIAAGPDAFRVNVSVLAEDGSEVFYIATDPNSKAKVFGKKSMAYVTAVSRQARWWRKPYLGGHTVLVSDAALGPALLSGSTRLAGCTWGGAAVQPGGATLTVTRGTTQHAVPLTITAETTLCGFLDAISQHAALGRAAQPVAAWFEAGGHLVLAALDANHPDPAAAQLVLPGGGPPLTFVSAKLDEVELYANAGAGKLFSDEPDSMPVAAYFESRDRDYDAFVLLPTPWPRRGPHPGVRRGVVHISFKYVHYVDAIWTGLEEVATVGGTNGAPAETVLRPDFGARHLQIIEPPMLSDVAVGASLGLGVRVLGQVIQVLSDEWFHGYGHTAG